MNKVTIIEDEKAERDNIKKIIPQYFSDIEIVGEADSVESGIRLIQSVNPDILIMDIEIKGGRSFEIIRKIGKVDFNIIWVTAYEQFAIQAFKFSAIDFLLKPYKSTELVEAIQKATEIINHQIYLKKLEALLHNLNIPLNKQIVIHTTEAFFILEVSDIVRCMADDNYTHFIMDNGEKIVVSKPLKKYETLLKDFGFCRVHQSHLVNLNKLVRFNKLGKPSLVLKNNDVIPVSKGMRSNIIDFLNSL